MALSQSQIESIRQRTGIVPANQVNRGAELDSAWGAVKPEVKEPSRLSKAVDTAGEFSEGVAKGILKTLKGASDVGEKVARTATRPFIGEAADRTQAEEEFSKKADEFLKPENTPQKIGFTAEQVAEFFVPAAKAAKAEQAINLLSQGIKSPALAAGARVLGKAAVQGGAAGGVRYLQSGGDAEEAGKTALTAGVVRGGMAIIGEGARALKLPERLYSTIFKASKDDMLSELRAGGIEKLRAENPKQYEEFVKAGIIKQSADGSKPYINETLAEQALHRGLTGSVKNMSNEVVRKTLETEDAVRKAVAGHKAPVDLSKPQYVSVLKKIAQEYDDVGFGEISDEANRLSEVLTKSKGMVSADDALDIRRFFDRMRLASSFDRPASSLSMTQSNLKTMADSVRSKINDIPGVGGLMKDYSFYLDALEALAKEGARRGNNQVLSLIDSVLLGGAAAGGPSATAATTGLTMLAARRFLASSFGATFLGQAIEKSAASPALSGIIGAGANAVNPEEKGQSENLQPQPQAQIKQPESSTDSITEGTRVNPDGTITVRGITGNEVTLDPTAFGAAGPIKSIAKQGGKAAVRAGKSLIQGYSKEESLQALDHYRDYLISELGKGHGKLNMGLEKQAQELITHLKKGGSFGYADLEYAGSLLRRLGASKVKNIADFLEDII